MPSKRPGVMIRTDQKTIQKLQYLAEQENRSLSNIGETIIKKHIDTYEHQHGPIVLPAAPQGADPADGHS